MRQAPVLIVLGLLMMEPITKVDFSDFTEGLPVFLTLILTLLTYSITDGLAFGFISYVLIKLFTGKSKEIPSANVCYFRFLYCNVRI